MTNRQIVGPEENNFPKRHSHEQYGNYVAVIHNQITIELQFT